MPYVINQEFCSACHQCRVECPVHAITFKNAKYWINPEKCISCGKCVRVCHNACISNPLLQSNSCHVSPAKQIQ